MTIIYVDGFPSLGEDPNNPGYTKPDRNGQRYPTRLPDGLTKWHMAKGPNALVPGVERDVVPTPSEPNGSVINSDFWKWWASLYEYATKKKKLRAMGVGENFLSDDYSSDGHIEITFSFYLDLYRGYLVIAKYKRIRARKQAQRRKRQARARTGRRSRS